MARFYPRYASIEAVRMRRAFPVVTPTGEMFGSGGNWLVTAPDGTLHVFRDEEFRRWFVPEESLEAATEYEPWIDEQTEVHESR